MKISEEIIPEAYNISQKVYEKEITPTEGKRMLSVNNKINENSAGDYINNFKYLLEDRVFQRTLNTASMDYFLENIYKDYGIQKLSNALSALKKHINYYEKSQKTTMHLMRMLLEKYNNKIRVPVLVSNIDQLIQNIEKIEFCLEGIDDEVRIEASNLIKRGTCFISYKVNNEMRFVPSRFVGYEKNNPSKYPKEYIDGRTTNSVISKILRSKPLTDARLEQEYIKYCISLGIKPQLKGGAYAISRKYWKLDIGDNLLHSNSDLSGEFPEGKIIERMHKSRERNIQVIKVAKDNFRNKHGSLFCEVCGFNFEEKYGEKGKDFIEGHHTIAVSNMQPEHKTKPEDIVMLCSNCHRMVHKHRPWLEVKDLRKILK